MDWKDFNAGPLSQQEWAHLTRYLRRQNRPIHIGCMGGHGRTGSALAIIATLLGCVPKGECPVKWIRDRYCSHAVETTSQLIYIEKITSRKVTSSPSSHSQGIVISSANKMNSFKFSDDYSGSQKTMPYTGYAQGSAVDDYTGGKRESVHDLGDPAYTPRSSRPRRPKPEDVIVDKEVLAKSYFRTQEEIDRDRIDRGLIPAPVEFPSFDPSDVSIPSGEVSDIGDSRSEEPK